MKYFFLAGTNPAMTISELSAVLDLREDEWAFTGSKRIFLIETEKEIDPALMNTLGGTVKMGSVLKEGVSKNDLVRSIQDVLEPGESKFTFGISFYGRRKLDTKVIGMETKTRLKERGAKARLVNTKGDELSSVSVEQNKLIQKGAEIVLIEHNDKIVLGKTSAVQPFKALSFRDYGRPSRDDRSGMLPPKLAMVMLNLSKAKRKDLILDPFCGSGTILSEALIAGYENFAGTDISDKAVKDTRENLLWISRKFSGSGHWEIDKCDATALSACFENNSIDHVVTEPYLGPQRGRIDTGKIAGELESLYSKTLREILKIMKKSGRVVMIWPVLAGGRRYISPDTTGYRVLRPLGRDVPGLSPGKNILYGRPDQKVKREIVILEKI